MNVRLHPALRCTFDAEENVLRLVLKEPVEQENVPPEEWARDIVVYALKVSWLLRISKKYRSLTRHLHAAWEDVLETRLPGIRRCFVGQPQPQTANLMHFCFPAHPIPIPIPDKESGFDRKCPSGHSTEARTPVVRCASGHWIKGTRSDRF